MANLNMQSAKIAKNDEYYTQLKDIENELRHYKHHFAGKTVYCNCDDPKVSNFFTYFSLNFEHLGLKKLITSCYRNTDGEQRTKGLSEKAVWLEYEGGDVNTIWLDTVEHEFVGDGDFRSVESIALLSEADIVVTNPPFSLFREYVAQLFKYDKLFLILGNINALTYKESFALVKENKMWLGNNTTRYFVRPDGEVFETARTFWYTNLDIAKRHEDLILYKTYNADEYPAYENYEGINVDKAIDIPIDYAGVMGVPITFIDKYNPDQFEILELGIVGSCSFTHSRKMEILKNGVGTGKFTINAKGTLYRKHNPVSDKKPPAFKDCETGELYQSIYARILIKHKRAVTTTL